MFSASAFMAEVVARSGADWVLVDLEHGTAQESDLVPMFMAIENAGSTPLVRVACAERIRVGRALDLGARGVMVPQIHTVADAEAVSRWMRTQPAGERGIALYTRGMDYGVRGHEGVAGAHEELLSIVQIETRDALERVDAIAAVDGVDLLFVGPADLSHAIGTPGDYAHPDFRAATQQVGRAARAHGRAAGILVADPADVSSYADQGFTFFSISTETSILGQATIDALRVARGAVAGET